MVTKKYISPLLVFGLALMIFAFPIKVPVSSAQGKLCCKGHCFMAMPAKKIIGGMEKQHSKARVACCQNHCLSVASRDVLKPRINIDLHASRVFAKSVQFFPANEFSVFPLATSPPGKYFSPPKEEKLHCPLFLANSAFLI